MSGISTLTVALIVWGVITGVLVVLLIYRSLVSMKEDDQLFLDSAQSSSEREQQQVRTRLQHLTPYTWVLGVTSGVLLLAIACLWAYQTLHGRQMLQ